MSEDALGMPLCSHFLTYVCNPSEGIPADITGGDDSGSFCCSVSALCVLHIIYCCLSSIFIMATASMSLTSSVSGCVFLPALASLRVGITHSLCIACLGAEHACSALKGADCPHCVRFSMWTLSSRRAHF